MSTRIMVLCGSPRERGNSNQLVSWFKKSAEAEGADVEIIDTTRLDYKNIGCMACMKCWKSDQYACAIRDDAQHIIARIPKVDVLVVATPVYWFGPSAQLKVFIDRMFCLIKAGRKPGQFRHTLAGKAMALLAAAGGDMDSGLNLVDLTFKTMAQFLEMSYDSLLVPCAPSKPQEMENEIALKAKVETLGRRIARRGIMATAI